MLTHLLSRLRAAGVREVTSAVVETDLRSGTPPVLIDIRSAEQFAAGHLPGAVHIPLERLGAEAIRLKPSAPTVVY